MSQLSFSAKYILNEFSPFSLHEWRIFQLKFSNSSLPFLKSIFSLKKGIAVQVWTDFWIETVVTTAGTGQIFGENKTAKLLLTIFASCYYLFYDIFIHIQYIQICIPLYLYTAISTNKQGYYVFIYKGIQWEKRVLANTAKGLLFREGGHGNTQT